MQYIGKILSLEGIDSSGKATQTKLLVQELSNQGYKVMSYSFPQYTTSVFGKEIGRYLNGEYGDINAIDPKLIAMLYANDRLEAKEDILRYLAEGYLVIMDRWVASNVVYQSSKLFGEESKTLADWITNLEYNIYGLPKEAGTIFLSSTVAISSTLMYDKVQHTYTDKVEDLHERDKDYLNRCNIAMVTKAMNDGWAVINVTSNGQLRSKEAIASQVLTEAKKILEL